MWELSTRQDALKKALNDVRKRAPAVAESTSIVCVSLRQVQRGGAWAKEQSERLGRDIHFLDADSLATWLSTVPLVSHWLRYELDGRSPTPCETVEEYLTRWSHASTPPLPPQLFVVGHERQRAQIAVQDWLRSDVPHF